MSRIREAWVREARERLEAPAPSGDWPLNDLRWALLRAAVGATLPNARIAASLREAPAQLARLGLTGPVSFAAHHRLSDFNCGVEKLNRQLAAAAAGAAPERRTHVLTEGGRVAAYYVTRPVWAFRRRDPEGGKLGLVLVSSLGVDLSWRRPGLARALVGSVLNQVFGDDDYRAAAGVIGFSLDPTVQRFFRQCGARALGEAIHREGVLVPRSDALGS
jgi:GNAT superfamily N-acetyltransferase